MTDIYEPSKIDVTIGSAAGTSGVVDLSGKSLLAFIVPATFAGTTFTYLAGTLKDNQGAGTLPIGNYYPVYDPSGNHLTTTIGTGRVITDVPELAPLRYIQIVSSATQTANRTVTVLYK